MAAHHDTDLLTIAEAAKLLRVSRVTIHRWLKHGRLPAYHVGPKAVRIQRRDLDAVMQPMAQRKGSQMNDAEPAALHTTPATIRPMTEEERRQTLEALEGARQLGERILARRGGKPFDETWSMIREAREERSKRLL